MAGAPIFTDVAWEIIRRFDKLGLALRVDYANGRFTIEAFADELHADGTGFGTPERVTCEELVDLLQRLEREAE